MDILKLQKYRRQVYTGNWNTQKKEKALKRKAFSNHSMSTDDGLAKIDREFLEYFINDTPLSELLDKFYNSKTSILDNWIGALGSANTKADVIKVNRLLGKPVTEKEIRKLYPPGWSDSEFQRYLEKETEELKSPEILVYICAHCGDYDCNGIALTIERTDTSTIWIIKNGDSRLSFEFDKHLYFEAFNKYLKQINP